MKTIAEICERLSSESGSLKKIEIISEALNKITSDAELNLFCLYLTGLIYPASVQKTINVGKALIRDAILRLINIEVGIWDKEFRKLGETGETVQYFLENYNKFHSKESALDMPHVEYRPSGKYSLNDFRNFTEELATTAGNLDKTNLVAVNLAKLNPLEAKYACKLLLQNLRIGVQEATVESAIVKAFDTDKKEVSKLNFYLGDIGEVAVRCKNKNFENVLFRLFHPIKAMLASAEVDVDEIFKRMKGKVWAEYKYDGIRAHIHKKADRVEIFTRDLKRITDQFPEVVSYFQDIKPDNFLIDGEIVPFSNEKIQPFAFIQKRLGRKENLIEEAKNNPCRFVAYDFIFLNDELVFEQTLSQRRNLLEEVFGDSELLFSSKKIVSTTEDFYAFFRQAKEEGREGLMVKNPDSKYEPGKRGIHWLKYKQTLDPLDVVILEADFGEGKNAGYLSSYTFGVWDEKKENLVPVGRVASGATEDDLKYFTEYLPKIAVEKTDTGYKLQPEIILEVGFENIQISERYTSGYAVRFPRILRIRTGDKPLEEISTLSDVKRTFEMIKI